MINAYTFSYNRDEWDHDGKYKIQASLLNVNFLFFHLSV